MDQFQDLYHHKKPLDLDAQRFRAEGVVAKETLLGTGTTKDFGPQRLSVPPARGIGSWYTAGRHYEARRSWRKVRRSFLRYPSGGLGGPLCGRLMIVQGMSLSNVELSVYPTR